MTSAYRVFEELKSRENLNNFALESTLWERLVQETMQISRKMSVLPTQRESDALPELRLLRDVAENLGRALGKAVHQVEAVEKYLAEDCFASVAAQVIKAKIYNDKEILRVADALFGHLVVWATAFVASQRPHFLHLLNTIIDKNVEYYRVNAKERLSEYTFGELRTADEQTVKFVEGLVAGTPIDVVKTSGNHKSWTRGVVTSREYNSLKVRYHGEQIENYVQQKNFEVAPLGKYSKDFEWREGLQVGAKVDYDGNAYKPSWKLYTITNLHTTTMGDGVVSKSIELTEDGGDSRTPLKDAFDDINLFRVHAPNIAPPGSRSNRGNPNFDDSDDAFYLSTETKPRYAIMRSFSHYASSSAFLVRYINLFGEGGGFDVLLAALGKGDSADVTGAWVRLVQSMTDYLVEPFIAKHGLAIFNCIKSFGIENTEKNLRNFSVPNLTAINESIANLAQRIFPSERAREESKGILLRIAFLCIKSDFVQKQIFGTKTLEAAVTKAATGEAGLTRRELALAVAAENIFEKLLKGHSTLILKSAPVFKLLFAEKLVTSAQLGLIWEQILKADLESKKALIALLGDVVIDLGGDEIRFLFAKIQENIENIHEAELELIMSIKSKEHLFRKDVDVSGVVNEILWQMLQRKTPAKKEFMREIRKSFAKALEDAAPVYTQKIVAQIREGTSIPQNLKLLRLLLKEHRWSASVTRIVKKEGIVDGTVRWFVSLLEEAARDTYAPAKQAASRVEGFLNEEPIKAFPPAHAKQISRVLKFLHVLLYTNREVEVVFTFESFEAIWRVLFKYCILEPEVTKWVSAYLKNEEPVSHAEGLRRFLHENLRLLVLPNRHEFFDFLVSVFFNVNIERKAMSRREIKSEPQYSYYYTMPAVKPKTRVYHVLQVGLEDLEGFPQLWELYLSCDSRDLEQSIANLIAKIASPFELGEGDHFENIELYTIEKQILATKCLELLNSQTAKLVDKSAGLLEKLMRKEEGRGFGVLRSFAALRLGEKVTVSFEKNTKYRSDKCRATLMQTDTIAELISKIAAELKMPYEAVWLMQNGETIPARKVTSTLEQVGITSSDVLLVNELAVPEKNQVPLLERSGEFTPMALAVFKEVFADYSKDGKMTKHDLALMTSRATDGNACPIDDDRITRVFTAYDPDNRGWISERDFLVFYLSCAVISEAKLDLVRRNLLSLGYGPGLQTKAAMQKGPTNKNSIRRLLIEKPELYTRFFHWVAHRRAPDSETAPAPAPLQSVIELLEYLTPSLALVDEIVDNPVEAILSALDDSFLLYYRLIVLHSLLSHRETFERIFEFCGRKLDSLRCQRMVTSLLNFPMILKTMRRIGTRDPYASPVFFKILRFLFSVGLAEGRPEFLVEMRNFSLYFVNLKSKSGKTSPAKKEGGKSEADRDETGEEANIRRVMHSVSQHWEAFIASVDFELFARELVAAARAVVEQAGQDFSKPTRYTANHLVALICAADLVFPAKFAELLVEDSPLLEVVIQGLLSHCLQLQLLFKSLYAFFSVNNPTVEAKKALLSRLITCIKTQASVRIHALIDIASHLLTEVAETKNSNLDLHTHFNLPGLFADFAQKLMAAESQEKAYDDNEDHNLSAILTFIDKIVTSDPAVLSEQNSALKTSLIKFIFRDCLFCVREGRIDVQAVACKSRRCREAAMSLLANLCKGDTKAVNTLMITGFDPLSQALPDFSRVTSYFFDSDRRAEFSFMGLKNLGCICYMIAMLQQFYCTPTFRYGLLMADDHKPVALREVKHRSIDDNVFHQLQKMFAYLDSSRRTEFNPVEFCLSYKDENGEPINCLVQQDAQEFLNRIFDKLDTSLARTPFKGFLESVYGGQTVNVITCKNCQYSKRNVELFLNLSLEVKNYANLTESFEKMIKEDIISDYLCEHCKNRTDVSKRCFLNTLPNVLIVHLQKLIFDMDTMLNVKLSSRYEFPMTVNVKKFVAPPEAARNETAMEEDEAEAPAGETQPAPPPPPPPAAEEPKDDEFEYKLVGVVVHRGTADSGHYTSLINVNRGDPCRKSFTYDMWLEFDDTRVAPFDMTHFEEECFGVAEDKEFGMLADSTTSKSAYILVYDKVKKKDIKIKFTPENVGEKERIVSNLIDKAAFRWNERSLEFETNFYNVNTYVPPAYATQIAEDNESVIMENQLLSKAFIGVFARILHSADLPRVVIESSIVPAATPQQLLFAKTLMRQLPNYIFEVLPYAEETPDALMILERLETAMIYNPQLMLQFFIEQVLGKMDLLTNLLLQANNLTTRLLIAQFLSAAVTCCIRAKRITSIDDVALSDEVCKLFASPTASNEEEREQYAPAFTTAIIKQLLDKFMKMATTTSTLNAKKLGYYFKFMHRCALNNPCIAEYFIQTNFFSTVHGFYAMIEASRTYFSDKLLTSLVLTMSVMLQTLRGMAAGGTQAKQSADYYNFYVRAELFEKLFKEDFAVSEAVEELVRVVVTDDRRVTDIVASVALQQADRDLELTPATHCLIAMLKIRDSLTEYRLKRLLGVPSLEGDQHKSGRFVYGLGHRPRLKETVYSFNSLYFKDKGVVGMIPDMVEGKMFICVTLLADSALRLPHVLEYLCSLPPYTFVSGCVFDNWPEIVSKYLGRVMAFDTYKPEIKALMDSAPQTIEKFVTAVNALAAEKSKRKNPKVFITDLYNAKDPLFTFRKRFLVGKTISSKLLFECRDEAGSDKQAGFTLHLDRVSLMDSEPTGTHNLALPEQYDYDSRHYAEQNADFWNFLDPSQYKSTWDTGSYGDTDRLRQGAHYKTSAELEQQKGCFFNDDFLLRLTSFNLSSHSFFAKIRVVHTSAGVAQTYDIATSLWNNTLLVIEKREGATTFGEIKVFASFLKCVDAHAKKYDDTLMPEPKLVYNAQF